MINAPHYVGTVVELHTPAPHGQSHRMLSFVVLQPLRLLSVYTAVSALIRVPFSPGIRSIAAHLPPSLRASFQTPVWDLLPLETDLRRSDHLRELHT